MNRRLLTSASALALLLAAPNLARAGDLAFDTAGGATAALTTSSDRILTLGDAYGGQIVTQSSDALGGRKTIIGAQATSSGNIFTITGSSTSYSNNVSPNTNSVSGPALTIGSYGSNNQMVVSGGADVLISPKTITNGSDQSNDVVIGYQAASGGYAGSKENDLTVIGAGSTFSTASDTPLIAETGTTLYLGYGGSNNTLHVLEGGSVQAYQMRIGGGSGSVIEVGGYGSNNAATIDGDGSALTVQGSLNLGAATAAGYGSSENSVTVSGGAQATVGIARGKTLSIGYESFADDNFFLVTGNGSSLTAYNIQVGSGSLQKLNSGNSLQIQNGGAVTTGTIAFNANSNFTVDANYSANAPLLVTGTASINGTSDVTLSFSQDGEFRKRTTLISAGTLSGTFGTFDASAIEPGFDADLAYDATHVYLDLVSTLGADLMMGQNQSNVANSLNSYFNDGGALPASFMAVYGLTGADLNSALTELSGETATAAQQSAYRTTGDFLNTLTQDFGSQSGGNVSIWGNVNANHTSLDGNEKLGNHGQASTDGAVTMGIDYNLANETAVGMSLSSGGTTWSSDNGLGNGSVTNLGFGLRARTNLNAAYFAAALGYGEQSVSIERDVFDEALKSDYTGNSIGGRLEAGLKVDAFVPYAAIQSVSFHNPTYSETGEETDFGLTIDDTTARKTSTELGVRIEGKVSMSNGSTWMNQARFAWIHNSLSNDGLTAGFSALSGNKFDINGASEAEDVALITLKTELRVQEELVMNASVSSELAQGSQSFALGAGLAYTW